MANGIHHLARAVLEASRDRDLEKKALNHAAISERLMAATVAYKVWRDAGYPIDVEAPQPPNTVKVRVAVSVTSDGLWAAAGGSGVVDSWTDEDSVLATEHAPGDRLSWITAYAPLPESAELGGEVSDDRG